jgi:hypothetical protein
MAHDDAKETIVNVIASLKNQDAIERIAYRLFIFVQNEGKLHAVPLATRVKSLFR